MEIQRNVDKQICINVGIDKMEISRYAQMQIYANGDKYTCINVDIYKWR